MGVDSLRPLSIGELLDRAFAISFKHIVALFSLVIVVVGPQIMFYYLGARSILDLLSSQLTSMQGAATGASALDPNKMLQAYANGVPFFLAFLAIGLFLVPLSNAAVVSGVSRAYLGLPVRFRDCYGDALPRWPALLGLTLLWFLIAFAAGTGLFVSLFLLTAALTAIGILGTAGIVISILLGIATGVVLLLGALQLYLAAAFSFVAAVLEGHGAGAALSSGFRRVFGENQFWRSLGIAAALFGIIIGVELVGGVIGWTAVALTHSFGLEFGVSALIQSLTYPFAFAVVALCYYDVRIRREGFDLQMLAARLGTAEPRPSPAP